VSRRPSSAASSQHHYRYFLRETSASPVSLSNNNLYGFHKLVYWACSTVTAQVKWPTNSFMIWEWGAELQAGS
jgi:hypothetical protein